MGSTTIRANDEPVMCTFLVETQREIEATGYIEKDAKGYVFKALTGDTVYFEPGEDLAKLHADKTMLRMTASLVEDDDGEDVADSYCMMHIK